MCLRVQLDLFIITTFGRAIKNSLDKDIILSGGGHNMAAGLYFKKNNLKIFEEFYVKKFFRYGFSCRLYI